MLVLTRKIGQRIILPDLGVVLTVLASTGGKVRPGFSAPLVVSIQREEVRGSVDTHAPAPVPSGIDTDDP